MRKSKRWIYLFVALSLFAAACSKPKDEKNASATGKDVPEIDAPVGSGAVVPTTAGVTVPGGAPAGAGAPGGAPAAPGAAAVPYGYDEAQANAVGALVKPESTEKVDNSAPGVTKDAIKLVFSYDATGCGVNVVSALTAAGGALPTTSRFYRAAPTTQEGVVADVEESIKIMVEYWNAHANDQIETFPALQELNAKFQGPGPFYGRKLEYQLVDGGSNQCPEKTTAAAKEAVEKGAFSVYNSYDGAQYNMAASLNAQPTSKRPMHFGSLWLSDSDYTRFAPYAWTEFATGTTIVRQYASYICSRVVTGQVPSRSPEMVKDPKKRVFGLVHTNVEQDKRLANEFKGYLKEYCPSSFTYKEIEYEGTDFGKAQQDNPNVVLQLKLAGVTSVMMLTEPIQPLFQMQIAQQQDYHPEYIYSQFGFGDTNTVMRLYDQGQTKNAFGITQLGVYGGFGFGSGDPFAMYHTSHAVAPSGKACDPSSDAGMDHDEVFCKAPTALVLWYYTLLPSIGGILFAGPDLKAETVSLGLQHYPTTRYGGSGPTSDPRPALVGAGEGKYGFIVDATEWRWRPEFISPKPEEKEGFIEYPDCMRHYIQWPDQLAPNWEKDGPNYGAWCGGPDGYPRVEEKDKQ